MSNELEERVKHLEERVSELSQENSELTKQVDFKIKECMEIAQAASRYKRSYFALLNHKSKQSNTMQVSR